MHDYDYCERTYRPSASSACDLLHGLDLRRRAHAAHAEPDIHRRADALVEELGPVSKKICPSVMEITFVGM